MQSQPQKNWQLSATSSKLNGVKADQAWSLLSRDYYSIHKYIPSLVVDTKKIDGNRHLTVTLAGSPPIYYTKDRLLKMDQAGRSYTYEVVENNLGLGKVVATVKVVPAGADSCVIEWSSVTEPAPGWTVSDFTNYLQTAASETAKKVGEILRAGKK